VPEARKALRQALAIGVLSAAVAAAVHFPLVQRFARGEFRETFFVQADYPGLRFITLAEAEDLWRAGEAAFLDARAADLYAAGHVPRARSVPAAAAKALVPVLSQRLDSVTALVVYCEGGECRSSLVLARQLHDRGFKDIRVLSGGWEEWKKAGLPGETGDDQE
jgi:rhodanese-related sulfurtransferase